jgi:hypothetical protein
MMKKIRNSSAGRLLLCWDWPIALLLTVALGFLVPSNLSYYLANRIFEAAMAVLAIMFSVFFAALAVLITAGDNEFLKFLQEYHYYRPILWPFKVTLLLLFLALVASVSLFTATLSLANPDNDTVFPRVWLMLFGFLSFYALFAAIQATTGAVRYAEFRAKFLDLSE